MLEDIKGNFLSLEVLDGNCDIFVHCRLKLKLPRRNSVICFSRLFNRCRWSASRPRRSKWIIPPYCVTAERAGIINKGEERAALKELSINRNRVELGEKLDEGVLLGERHGAIGKRHSIFVKGYSSRSRARRDGSDFVCARLGGKVVPVGRSGDDDEDNDDIEDFTHHGILWLAIYLCDDLELVGSFYVS